MEVEIKLLHYGLVLIKEHLKMLIFLPPKENSLFMTFQQLTGACSCSSLNQCTLFFFQYYHVNSFNTSSGLNLRALSFCNIMNLR